MNRRELGEDEIQVAPSRARGLKLLDFDFCSLTGSGRALTGAWIETRRRRETRQKHNVSRPHGRVD